MLVICWLHAEAVGKPNALGSAACRRRLPLPLPLETQPCGNALLGPPGFQGCCRLTGWWHCCANSAQVCRAPGRSACEWAGCNHDLVDDFYRRFAVQPQRESGLTCGTAPAAPV